MKSYRNIFFKFGLQTLAVAACFITTNESFAETRVAQRVAVTSRAAPRINTASRITPVAQPVVETVAPVVADEPIIETETPVDVIENKSLKFDSVLGDSVSNDSSVDARAEMIRNQRAVLDAANTQTTAKKVAATAIVSGKVSCDSDLRTCMKQKCNNDFSKCAGDGDTVWGDKLNSCKNNSTCSGEEFKLFATEIKADRDYNAKLSSYTQTIECGNNYNKCIIAQCGNNFSKCIGKVAADQAISACATVASVCQQVDNGLVNRTQQIFGTLRNNASAQVKNDEARLYKLRDLMSEQCKSMGALFDERSLDCVFTVNLFAGKSDSPMASKKLYAGDSFDCNQDWFGIDVTTYKENAYRLTRSQTGASSAMLGAGLGIAAGAISSGAISRAIDTQKAEKALDAAKEVEKETTTDKSDGLKKESKDNNTSVTNENKSSTISGFVPPTFNTEEQKHDWYSKECDGSGKIAGHVPKGSSECSSYSTGGGADGCDFTGYAVVADGAAAKCKKCTAEAEDIKKYMNNKKDFCRELENKLLAQSKK